MSNKGITVNQQEVKKFSNISSRWWDMSESSPFFHLHLMNPLRIKFVLDSFGSLKDKHLLDIGCGGGIASLSFARIGANVVAIDASQENISIAKEYALGCGVNVDYRNIDLGEINTKFDVITCFEVIEHVDNLEKFSNDAVSLLKPGGMLFISTMNRTKKSYLAAIIAAEYIMRYVPIGTHDWKKFVKPSELVNMIPSLELKSLSGMKFNLMLNEWEITRSVDVNYIAGFIKQ